MTNADNTNITLTVSLNRVHALIKRAGQRASEIQERAMQVLERTDLPFGTAANAELVARLVQRKHEAIRDLDMAADLVRAVGDMRAAVATANAEKGIDRLLARQATLRRLASVYKQIGNMDALQRVPATATAIAAAMARNEPTQTILRSGIRVGLLDETDIRDYRERAERLQREVEVLADELATANGHRISVVLDRTVAQQIGVA